MSAVGVHIKKINELYAKLRSTNDKQQKDKYRKHIKELEDDLLEYCSWQQLDYKKISRKIVK